MLLGIIRGLEALCDVIEYGPAEAFKINTSGCPEAERACREIMANIDKKSQTSLSSDGCERESAIQKPELDREEAAGEEVMDDRLVRFGEAVEELKINFSTEPDAIDLRLIYKYHRLNAYGKVIMDKISSRKKNWPADLNRKEQLKQAFLFKERCQQGECDKYSFIFWALMVLTVDDTDKEERLSQIREFSRFLGINDEEMRNIKQLIYVVCRNK